MKNKVENLNGMVSNTSTLRVLLFTFSTQGATGDYPAKLANGLTEFAEVHVVCPEDPTVQELFNDGVTTHRYQTKLKPGIQAISTGTLGTI